MNKIKSSARVVLESKYKVKAPKFDFIKPITYSYSKNLCLPTGYSILNIPDLLEVEPPPSSNTGGNFSAHAKKTESTQQQVCCIDYLTLSFDVSAFNVPFPAHTGEASLDVSKLESRSEWLENIAKHVRQWMQLENIFILDKGRGFLGFSNSANIVIRLPDQSQEQLGTLAWGGASQNGRVMLSLSGTGTALIEEWEYLADFICMMNAKITRVDLAVDFLHGEYSIDEAICDYDNGNYKASLGGSSPSARLIHDMGSQEGKTFYIGKRENGKMMRIYEKGRQLGDKSSEWVRVEAEIHNKDRVIPYDVLINPLAYWSGMNPAFFMLIPFASKQIKTAKKVIEATLSSLSHYASVGYGKLINTLMYLTQDNAHAVIDFLTQAGTPRRLRLPLALGGYLEQLEVSAGGRFLNLNLQE